MGSSLSLMLSEGLSIVGQSISKIFYLFILIFTTSIFMKFCFYQRTSIWVFAILLIFNLFLGGGLVYFFWYIFLHGTRGQYVPRALPLFPMLWTQVRMNDLGYLIKQEGCDSANLPQLPANSGGRYNSPNINIFQRIFYFWFQREEAASTDDIQLIAGKNASVNPIIFGENNHPQDENYKYTGGTNDTSYCNLRYNGIYTLDNWAWDSYNIKIPN